MTEHLINARPFEEYKDEQEMGFSLNVLTSKWIIVEQENGINAMTEVQHI